MRVHGLGYIVDSANADDRLLIVDDVFDTGLSVRAIIDELHQRARRNMPHDVRVATPWFKPSNNLTDMTPDYYIHETDRWLVFPHELQGLTRAEIVANKPGMAVILEELEKAPAETPSLERRA